MRINSIPGAAQHHNTFIVICYMKVWEGSKHDHIVNSCMLPPDPAEQAIRQLIGDEHHWKPASLFCIQNRLMWPL